MRGVIKAVMALVIVVIGAGIGFLIANNTEVGKTSAVTPTPVVVAAGAAPATPIPTFTPVPDSNNGAQGRGNGAQSLSPGAARNGNTNTTPGNTTGSGGANSTPGAGGQRQGQNQRSVVTGTIASFDAGSKTLVVSEQDGTKKNVLLANANLTKPEKITLDEISKANNAVLVVQGDKNSNGVYDAKSVNLINPAASQGNRAGGFGGGNFGGANAGAQGQTGLIILTGATVSGTTMTGKTFQGDEVKVNVLDTTTFSRQAPAAPEDLTEGKTVSINGQVDDKGNIQANSVVIQS